MKIVGDRRKKMRRMVAVAVIVVFACALFLVLDSSAKAPCLKDISTNLTPQNGSSNSRFNYSITLTNDFIDGNYDFNLIIGSNKDYPDRTISFHKSKFLDGSSEPITFSFSNIHLSSLKSKDSQFRNFMDGKGGWMWDKCWYRFDIVQPFYCEPIDPIEKDGPILFNINEYFENASVNTIYKDLSFDYSVNVTANKEDNNIRLFVKNYASGKFEPKGESKSYDPAEGRKQLTWTVNLTEHNFKNFEGQYKFVGSYNVSPPEGHTPGWHIGPVIEEKYDKRIVRYNGTINELLFDYEVQAWVNMVEDKNITLEVKNFQTDKWEPKGIRHYTTPGICQPLNWTSIKLSCDYFDDDRHGRYRFVGTYGNSSSREAGHIGPDIEERFYNFNVTPPDGTINDTFTYSVTVNANISDKIDLQVLNHTSGNWTSKGTKSYTTPGTPDTLVWPNIKLNIYELNPLNDARYRFVGFCNKSKSEEKESPFWETGLKWDDISVKPERDLWNAEFNYCIHMYAKRNLSVKLVVYKPSDKEWLSKEEIYNDTKEYTNITNWTTFCWNIKPFIEAFEKENCVGDAGYKFIFYRKGEFINETNINKGPYVNIAKFTNATVEPKNGIREMTFTYTVIVNATEKGEVWGHWEDSLSEHSDDKSIAIYDEPNREVRYSYNMTFKEWELGNISYRFKFEDSKSIPSEEYTGPLLIEEKFSNFSVNPDEGNYTTCFNFSANLSSSKPGNVPVTLQVRLDEAADDAYWEDVATKRYENDIPESQIPINFTVCIDENEVTKNLASAWVKNKVIFWRVKGLVNESITIPTRYNISLKWYNPSVSPEEGWWYDSFSFRVSLSAIENGTVALQVNLNESDSDWQNRGKVYNYFRPYPESFTWLKETLCDDSFTGNTWYRFEFTCGNATYYSNDSCLEGPKLFIPLNISFTDGCVEEKEDVIFNETFRFRGHFNETSNTFFNFSINVTANDTTAVDLILVDSGNNHHPDPERDYKIYTEPPKRLPFTWTRKELPLAQIGNWNYTFRYNDSRYGTMTYNKTFVGPRIIAVFKNYTIYPYPILFNRTHNVTVLMTATIPMEVELEAFNLYKNKRIWEPVGTRVYEPPEEQPLNWTINTFDMPFDNLRLNWKKKENGE